MAKSFERTLEDAIVILIEALSYISTASVTITYWANSEKLKAPPIVAVHVSETDRIAPNYPMYKTSLDLHMYTTSDDDSGDVDGNAMYDAVWDWLHNVTAAQLSSASGLQIDGITFEPNEIQISGDQGQQTVRMLRTVLYLTL